MKDVAKTEVINKINFSKQTSFKSYDVGIIIASSFKADNLFTFLESDNNNY